MTFESKINHESESFPGVKFTVRRLNSIQRAKRDAKMLEQRVRISELDAKQRALPKVEPDQPDSAAVERARLTAELETLESEHFKPAYIRAGMISIEGFEVEGKAGGVEDVLEHAPDELIAEIYLACIRASGLTEIQQGNSQSPSTSTDQEGGGETSTTAKSADTRATTKTATAGSSRSSRNS